MPMLRPLLTLSLLLAGLAAWAASPARAEEDPTPGALTLETERVVVFKDGYGLFVKRAEGTADAEGIAFTEEVPDAAALGSFWATAGDANVGMRAEWVERTEVEEKEIPCATVADVLEANVGRDVTLRLHDETRPTLVGKILEAPTGAEFVVVLKTSGHRVVLPVKDVRTVEGAPLATKVLRRTETAKKVKRLSFDLGPAHAGKPVSLHLIYFRPGIRWIPTYRLDGDLETEGRLSLQGEVVNDAEDLDGVPLHLVVGVPNFRFKEAASPLALETVMRSALSRMEDAIAQSSNNMFSNAILSQRATTGGGRAGGEPRAIDAAPELATAAVQDLFLYEAPAVRLAKGARASVPLWSSTIPLSHLYTLTLDPVRDASGRSLRRSSRRGEPARTSPLELARNDVWHQIELSNVTQVPWTTGAVLVLQEGRPIAQEILGYTAPKATSLLPLTVATSFRSSVAQEELAREPRAANWAGYSYARIRVREKIVVTSFLGEKARIRVTLRRVGRATEAPGSEIVIDARSRDVNPFSTITWDLTLAPDETRMVTATIDFHVRE